MNTYLTDLLKEELHVDDLMSVDYKEINPATKGAEINLRNVRGSIRMQQGLILTPHDIEEQKKKLFSMPPLP